MIYEQDDGQHVVNETSITDFPRFGFRGFLIDTSRFVSDLLLVESFIVQIKTLSPSFNNKSNDICHELESNECFTLAHCRFRNVFDVFDVM